MAVRSGMTGKAPAKLGAAGMCESPLACDASPMDTSGGYARGRPRLAVRGARWRRISRKVQWGA